MTRKKETAEPKIVMKGARNFRHDLFKAKVANKAHNTSFKRGEPKIVDVEHCHFFHTHDSHGRPQNKTTSQAGHWHDVEWWIDENTGELKAKCGPPMHKVTRDPVSGKQFKRPKVQQVKYFHDEMNEGEGGALYDDHTHDMEYVSSEKLNEDKVRARNRQTAEGIPGQHIGTAPAPIEGFNP